MIRQPRPLLSAEQDRPVDKLQALGPGHPSVFDRRKLIKCDGVQAGFDKAEQVRLALANTEKRSLCKSAWADLEIPPRSPNRSISVSIAGFSPRPASISFRETASITASSSVKVTMLASGVFSRRKASWNESKTVPIDVLVRSAGGSSPLR